jgi:hypothetical protein
LSPNRSNSNSSIKVTELSVWLPQSDEVQARRRIPARPSDLQLRDEMGLVEMVALRPFARVQRALVRENRAGLPAHSDVPLDAARLVAARRVPPTAK